MKNSPPGAYVVRDRMTALDGLRGLAAVLIVVFHFAYFYLPQANLFAIVPPLRRAYLAVDLFFLLSGFVMAYVHGDELAADRAGSRAAFASARVARIYPLFMITTLCLVIEHAAFDLPMEGISFAWPYLLLQPLMLQAWAPQLNWNYPGWSISTEAAAYVLFVFSAKPLLYGRRPVVTALACLAVLAAIGAPQHGIQHLYVGVPALLRTVTEFTGGVLLYRLRLEGVMVTPRSRGMIAAGCLVGLAVTHWDIFIVMAFACLIHHVGDPATRTARILGSRWAVALGAWSYSLYLWHAPLHYGFSWALAAAGHPVDTLGIGAARGLVLVSLLVVLLLSAASFRFIERPLRSTVRDWLSSVRTVEASSH